MNSELIELLREILDEVKKQRKTHALHTQLLDIIARSTDLTGEHLCPPEGSVLHELVEQHRTLSNNAQ